MTPNFGDLRPPALPVFYARWPPLPSNCTCPVAQEVLGSAPTWRCQTLRSELMEQRIPCARWEKPVYKICHSYCRLCALFEPSAHENCGTSQALYTPMMKLPTVSGFLHSLCAPLMRNAAGRLSAPHDEVQASCTLSALHSRKLWNLRRSAPRLELAERLRASAPP